MPTARATRRHAGMPAGLRNGPVYMDYNATTPVDSRVLAAMMPFLDTHFGNPSSSHHYGDAPHAAVARAREQIAALIGAVPDEITFTGSGSEADAMAIRGVAIAAIDAMREPPPPPPDAGPPAGPAAREV